MGTFRYIAASAALAVCAPALAVNTADHDIPYIAGFGAYTIVDNDRSWDDDFGFQATIGVPLSWENYALEFSFFGDEFERDIDGDDDFRNGITIDLVRDFGGMRFLTRADIVPYVLAGVGAVRDDVEGKNKIRPVANGGVGALWGLGLWGMALRTEFRLLGQHQSLSSDDNLLLDYRFLLGLQVPLTPIFGRTPAAVPPPPAEECEVAVVDPITGRTDCRSDSDGDGVTDETDQCPGTPAGVRVDESGCPVMAGADADGDGVADAEDLCPDTYPGVTVNTQGCAEPQPLVIPGLTFEFDTSRLTADARVILDDVAAMLEGQQDLTVEIIGHTDSKGADAYNQRLSEQRAAAVKAHLESLGIGGQRLTTTGRGSAQPVASNDTEEGRAANRRVAFWLYLE